MVWEGDAEEQSAVNIKTRAKTKVVCFEAGCRYVAQVQFFQLGILIFSSYKDTRQDNVIWNGSITGLFFTQNASPPKPPPSENLSSIPGIFAECYFVM